MTYRRSMDAIYDRIVTRLKASVEAERWTVTCGTCQSKFDTRHYANCPYCASRDFQQHRRRADDVQFWDPEC